MKTIRLILLGLAIVSWPACGDDDDDAGTTPTQTESTPSQPDGGANSSATDSTMTGSQAGAPVSFSKDIQTIFTSTCALAGCHAGANPAAGQDLSEGKAFASIVGVAARSSCIGQIKVEPANPDASVLVKKIEGTTCGSRMPLGRTPLGSEQIALIRAWIQEGAQGN